MSLEKNKAVIRRFFETLNKKDLSLLDEFVHPDYIEHTMKLKGLEGVKQMMTKFYKGFPDLHVTIERIIAEDDMVWIKVKITGTHLGEYIGLTPTGKNVIFSGVDIARLENGKIILKPVKTKKYSLNDLLKKVNKNNLHSEIDTGETIGNEEW